MVELHRKYWDALPIDVKHDLAARGLLFAMGRPSELSPTAIIAATAFVAASPCKGSTWRLAQ